MLKSKPRIQCFLLIRQHHRSFVCDACSPAHEIDRHGLHDAHAKKPANVMYPPQASITTPPTVSSCTEMNLSIAAFVISGAIKRTVPFRTPPQPMAVTAISGRVPQRL